MSSQASNQKSTLPSVVIDDKHASWLIMDYLLERRCYEALVSMQLELGIARRAYSSEALFAYMLVIQGRLDDTLVYLKPLQRELGRNYENALFSIYKQKYLEALSWQGGGGHLHALLPYKPELNSSSYNSGHRDGVAEPDNLVRLLKSLESYCSSAEFEELVKYLTLYRLSDHPAYKHWSVPRGRIECAADIARFVALIYPESDTVNGGDDSFAAAVSSSMSSLPPHYGRDALVALCSAGILNQVCGEGYTNNRSSSSSAHEIIDTQWSEAEGTICTSQNADIGIRQKNIFEVKNRLAAKSAYSICEEVSTALNIYYSSTAKKNLTPTNNNNDNKNNIVSGAAPVVAAIPVPQHSNKQEDVFEFSKQIAILSPRAPVSWTVDINEDKVGGTGGSSHPKLLNRMKSQDKSDKSSKNSNESSKTPSSSSYAAPEVIPGSPARVGMGNNRHNKPHSPSSSASTSSARHAGHTSIAAETKLKQVVSPTHSNASMKSKSDLPPLPFTLFQHHAPIRCVSIIPNVGPYHSREVAPDDVIFALGTNSKSVHILQANVADIQRSGTVNTSNMKLVTSFNDAHSGSVYCMDYSADVGALVTGSNDKSLRILNISSNSISDPLVSHSGTVRVVKFRPTQLSGSGAASNQDGSRYAWNNTSILASGGAGDCAPRIWDVAQGCMSSKLSPNAAAIHGLSWMDNYSLMSGCEKGSIALHDIRDIANSVWATDIKQLIYQSRANCDHSLLENLSHNLSIFSMTSDIDNQVVYLGCAGGYTCSIDIRNQQISGVDKPHGDDVRSILSYSTMSQRHYLMTSSYDSSAHIFSCVARSSHHSSRGFELEKVFSLENGHTDKILSTVIVNHGKHSVITTGADGKAIYWI